MGGSPKDLEQRYKAVLSPVLGRYTWLQLERGEGSWLHTRDGRRVLDLTCGIAVTPIGHSHPKVVRAISDQAARLLHISAGVAAYEPNVALAEALVSVAPAGLDTVFFQNSGAEAVEASVKLARKVTGRQAVVAFRGGFHGRTTGAAALTSSKSAYKKGYGALLPEVHIAPYPYPLACRIQPPHDADACTRHALDELDLMLEHEVPPEHVAAFLIEPILGEGGYWPAPHAFLRELRALATRIGALVISDEVQTGLGRSGAWLGITRAGVTPDIVTLAKALGGGLPLGAVLAPRALHDKWGTGTHGSTFGGNPVSCAAGLATFGVIRDERLVERADRELERIMLEELAPLGRAHNVRDVRATGAMGAIEFDTKETATKARLGALERDVLVITCGAHDQVIRLIPPLNISEEDLRGGIRRLVEAARGAAVPV